MASITIPPEQWSQILQLLRECPDVYVGDAAECKRFVEGVLWMDRSGAQWRLLPAEYGNWNTIYKRFARWCDRGVWERLHQHFSTEPDLEYLVIDSTVVRAHQCAGGAPAKRGAISASPGPQSRRVQHEGSRERGRSGQPPAVHVDAPGQQHDITQVEALLTGYRNEYVIADKGYDAQDFVDHLSEEGMVAVIPPRSNRKAPRDYDRHLYRERHVVECFIGKIKHYRRIFSRFDKLASRYLGFLQFAAALIWLR